MADTSYLKNAVEPYVREDLQKGYGVPFRPQVLRLRSGGTHEFDAVSQDLRIVCSIKTAGGKTSSGKNPSGKVKDCEAELYYLTLMDSPIRLLALTSAAFYELLIRRLDGRLYPGLLLKLVPLPPDMQGRVEEVQRKASAEVSPPKKTE